MRFKVLCLVLAFLAIVNAEVKNYDGFKLYKVIPKNADEVETLRNIKISGITEFWDDIFDVNHDVRIMVPAGFDAEFLEKLEKAKIESKLIIDNVQRAINDQLVTRRRGSGSSGGSSSSSSSSRPSGSGSSSSSTGKYWTYSTGTGSGRRRYERNSDTLFSLTWDRYHRLEAIYAWLDELAEAFPDRARTVVMGQSVEGRDIKGIIINMPAVVFSNANKDFSMLEGGLHAREWISPATVTWIIKEFLTSDDPEVMALANEFEWHIFPVVNPDGYSYTFTDHRMWRKNRSKTNFTSCASSGVDDDLSNGVDLNRNFDFAWNTVGTSNDPCSNVFPGPSPASEPETQAIMAYIRNLKASKYFMYYIAFHSYTQLMIVPYSHLRIDQEQAHNYADMFEIAVRGADVLQQRYGTTYRVGISSEVMYEMSGTSFDWAKNAANIPVAYLIELRDLGEFGFLLPADQIIPNNLEIMDAFLEMDRATRDLKYYERRVVSTGGVGSLVASMLLVIVSVLHAILH